MSRRFDWVLAVRDRKTGIHDFAKNEADGSEGKVVSASMQLLVAFDLSTHMDDDGLCWPSLTTIAKECRLSRAVTNDVINALLATKRIVYEAGDTTHSNRYLAVFPSEGGTPGIPGRWSSTRTTVVCVADQGGTPGIPEVESELDSEVDNNPFGLKDTEEEELEEGAA